MIAPLCWAQSLRREADCTGILVGTAVRTSQFSESAYATTLVREFNMMQAEDVMKWSTIRPDRQTFNFTLGDQVVDFAQAHDMKVRGHTLLWGRHNPEWLNGADYNPGMLSELLRDHITKSSTIEEKSSPGTWSTRHSMKMESSGARSGMTGPASASPVKETLISSRLSVGRTRPIQMCSSFITMPRAKR